MPATYLQPVSNPALSGWRRQPGEVRRRAVAIGLTIVIHLLLLWLLLNLSPRTQPFSTDNGLQAFDVSAERPAAQPKQQAHKQQQQKRVHKIEPKVVPPQAPPIVYKDAPNVIWMTREQFAKTDISKLKKPADTDAQQADAGADSGAGRGNSKALQGPGAGPGGQQLYAAEWYREPTSAELNTYLPPAPADSWGTIACKTVPDFRVENCQTMGESPVGSGIATGMRRASWQFRVRPPRINGKPQYGTWVRIRIDFTLRGAEVGR